MAILAEQIGVILSAVRDTSNNVLSGGTVYTYVSSSNNSAINTTGNITNGSNQLTNLASTTGIVAGCLITGAGIPNGTVVNSIVSTTVTMSNNATATTTGVSVKFYPQKSTWAGADKSSASNSVSLDANGRAVAYGDGQYRFIIKDSIGTFVYDWDNLSFEVSRLVDVRSFGAVGDGSTDDSTAINAAIASLTSGGSVFFPPTSSYYKCSSNIQVLSSDIKLFGLGEASKIVLGTGIKLQVVAIDGTCIENLWIDGTQSVSGYTNAALIEAFGTSPSAYNNDLKISRCKFTNAPYFGIVAQYYNNVEITDSFFDTIFYSACELMSCDYSSVIGNTIKNIATVTSSPPINAYGVAFSGRTGSDITGTISSGSNIITSVSSVGNVGLGMLLVHDDIPDGAMVIAINVGGATVTLNIEATGSASGATIKTTARPCWYGVCSNNIVQNNPIWTALDTHGGRYITFSGNSVSDCYYGITVGSMGDWKQAPKNVTVSGNTVRGFNRKDNTLTVTGSGSPATTMTLSGSPYFTIKVGDYLVVGTDAKKITALTSQTIFTVASAFSGTPSGTSCIVTQEGYSNSGCSISGAEKSANVVKELATGLNVVGNTFMNCGLESDSSGSALFVRTVGGANISGNTFQEPNGYAIYAYYDNYGVNICDNTCIDPWSFTKTNPAFLAIVDDQQFLTVSGNSIKSGVPGNPYKYVLKNGIVFIDTDEINQNVTIGGNFYDGGATTFISNAPSQLPLGVEILHPQRWVATTAPTSIRTSKTWNVGDIVYNKSPSNGTPIGWYCTTAGSPGSWIALPTIGFAPVAASYKTSADRSISNGTTNVVVNFDTTIFDDSSRVTTGASWKYTAQFAGKYRISCKVTYGASESWTQAGYLRLFLYKNGSVFLPLASYTPLSGGTYRIASLIGNIVIKLAANDYIDIRTRHGESSARTVTYNGIDSDETWISIDCIGDT